MRPAIARPEAQEFAPYYVTYVDATSNSLAASGSTDIRDLLASQCDMLEALVSSVSDEQANLGYAPGKWTLKESIVHVCDAERIFSYRALRIARGDETPLASFEQDGYVPESRANSRTMANILAEFRAIRASTIALVASFDAPAINKRGTASGQTVSTRALCWIMTGHVAHHVGLTRDRYLPALSGAK
ncbi:MAG: DinB family protein [Gemmatimonadaceae bacterium]